MNGVAITLEATEEAECEEADEQADQGQKDPNPRNDIQQHVVHRVRILKKRRTGGKMWVFVVSPPKTINATPRQNNRMNGKNKKVATK